MFCFLVLERLQQFGVALAAAGVLHGVEDGIESRELLFHLLVVASALVRSPGLNELGHLFEDLVGPPELFPEEILPVSREENAIQLFLDGGPMANVLGSQPRTLVFRSLGLLALLNLEGQGLLADRA